MKLKRKDAKDVRDLAENEKNAPKKVAAKPKPKKGPTQEPKEEKKPAVKRVPKAK